jgi:hypothetical protein
MSQVISKSQPARSSSMTQVSRKSWSCFVEFAGAIDEHQRGARLQNAMLSHRHCCRVRPAPIRQYTLALVTARARCALFPSSRGRGANSRSIFSISSAASRSARIIDWRVLSREKAEDKCGMRSPLLKPHHARIVKFTPFRAVELHSLYARSLTQDKSGSSHSSGVRSPAARRRCD